MPLNVINLNKMYKYSASKTKIIATIGPSSANKSTLKEMIIQGVDVCRLNFSHGTHAGHLKTMTTIQEINNELNTHVAILADLQGPKIRIGQIEDDEAQLITNQIIELVGGNGLSNAQKLFISYDKLAEDVKTGESILIDDGKIKLEIVAVETNGTIRAKVIFGGVLKARKGVNLPNTTISQACLTEKDVKDARFALSHNVDWIALSFVRSASDILALRELINEHDSNTAVIAKIEKPEALDQIDFIIEVADGIMIARGDLGVEVDFYEIPVIQKNIISLCRSKAKPVIVATQMMESMIHNFRPTRAEATDVANAVIEGTDTVMLSGETSVGLHPVNVIIKMHQLIQFSEEKAYNYFTGDVPKPASETFMQDLICYNACKMAQNADAKAIITFSHSGYTAFKISSYRPSANLYVFTSNKDLIPVLSLVWGVKAFYFDNYENIDTAVEYSISQLKKENYLADNEIVVHAASTPLDEKGATNMLKISKV